MKLSECFPAHFLYLSTQTAARFRPNELRLAVMLPHYSNVTERELGKQVWRVGRHKNLAACRGVSQKSSENRQDARMQAKFGFIDADERRQCRGEA
jgi:hypothetical protein